MSDCMFERRGRGLRQVPFALALALLLAACQGGGDRVPVPCASAADCGPGDSCEDSFCALGAPLSGPASAAQSALVVGTDPVPATGRHDATVVVRVRDAQGNPVPNAPVTLSASGSGNTLRTSNPGGRTNYWGEVISYLYSTTAETKTLSASVAGSPLPTQQVSFVPAGLDAGSSTLVASAAQLAADGVAQTVLTATVRDARGNPVAGQSVVLSVSGSGNTLSPASGTTDARGVVTATLRSTVAEAKTVRASVPPAFALSTQVTFTPGALDAGRSALVASRATLPADGTSTTRLELTARDAQGNAVPAVAVQLDATGSGNTLLPASGQTGSDGRFLATLASTKAEQKTVTVHAGAATYTQTVTFTSGAVSPSLSTVQVSPPALAADGVSATTITVLARDATGNPLPGHAVQFFASGWAPNNVFDHTSATTDQNGVATAHLASRTRERKTVQATVREGLWTSTTVDFTAPPSAAQSQLTSSPGAVPADGATPVTVSLVVKDAQGNRLAGQLVALAATGTNTLSQTGGLTDSTGSFSATVRSTEAGIKTLTATVGPTGPSQLALTAPVTFQSLSPVTLSPASATLYTGATQAFSAAGGLGPYTFSLASGGGTIAGSSYTAPSTATTATVRATDSLGSSGTATVSVLTPQSAAQSQLSVAPTALQADGVTTATVSLVVKDASGNRLAGRPVVLSATGTNTLSKTSGVTDSNGAFSATVRSTEVGSKTLTATVGPAGSGQIALTTAVTFQTVPPVTVSPSSASLYTGTTQAFSAAGGLGPYTYRVLSGGGSVSGSSYTAPATATTATVRATDSQGRTADATIVVSTPPSSSLTQLTASPGTLPADGTTLSTVSLVAKDVSGTRLPGLPVTLSATGTNTLSPTSGVTDSTGSFSATLRSTQTGIKTLTAVVGWAGTGQLTRTASVTFQSTVPVTVSPSSVTMNTGSYQTFSAAGGVGPYTFSVVSGGGSFSGASFTAPAAPATVVVRATDTLGSTGDATLTVIAPPVLQPSNYTQSLYHLQQAGVSVSPPFSMGGWVYVTGGRGYIFSLGDYINPANDPQAMILYHSGIVADGNSLLWAWQYDRTNLPPSFTVSTLLQAKPAGWFYLAVEVTPSYLLRWSVNGTWLGSVQLSANALVDSINTRPQAGRYQVGYGDANAVFFDIAGNLQNLNVWSGLYWYGQPFTPPVRQ